ncbi:hypothetical protein ES708_14452 [subsurface metagenome]
MLILFLKNIPFNPSLGFFLSEFVFSIIEKKIKVKINSYRVLRIAYRVKKEVFNIWRKTKNEIRISYIGKIVNR